MSDKSFNKQSHISGKRVLRTSFAVDILDVIFSLIVTILSGSVVMFTQVLEGLVDAFASGFLLIGHSRSAQREDRAHPFGYGTEIYFWSFLSAIIMFAFASTLSFYLGWKRFMNPTPINNIGLAFLILVITLFTNGYAFFLSYARLLKKRPPKHIIRIFYRSSLVETKTTFVLDLMGTLASLLGIVALGIYLISGDVRFDGLGAMVIGVVLAVFSLFLVLGTRELLVGKRASEETEAKIKKAALQVQGVEDVLGIKTLYVGSDKLLVDLDVYMQSRLSTRELEILMDKIKGQIREKVPSARYIQVELETPRKK
jgi:cation diffusion facilitator family transporter